MRPSTSPSTMRSSRSDICRSPDPGRRGGSSARRGWVLCAGVLAAAAHAQETSPGPKFSGYAKSLLIDSTTLVGAGEHYTLDLNRVRLELKGPVARRLAIDLQYDNE